MNQNENRKFKIGRPINGISINGNEFVLDDDGKEMLFDSEKDAMGFLNKFGYTKEDVEDEGIVFVEVKG